MMRAYLLVLVCLVAVTTNDVNADTITVSGIQKFNQSLGVLDSVTVTIDPPFVVTSTEDVLAVNTHTHLAAPAPLPVPGLGFFNFPATPTGPGSNGLGGDHSHALNLHPSVKLFSGPSLNWFLTPGPPVNSVTIPTFFTNQGGTSSGNMHNHRVNSISVTPMTTFNFTVVPEPSCVVLAFAGLALMAGRGRRS